MATINDTTQRILDKIGSYQTLIEMFPMSDFSHYNSNNIKTSIQFYIAILKQLGLTERDIIEKIIGYLFETTNVDSISDEQPEWMAKLEVSLKTVVQTILTAMLSCSVVPHIPSKRLDQSADNQTLGVQYGSYSIPVSTIDYYGMLQISPLSKIGKYYYSNNSGATTNSLYKTKDLNTFIWYSLNRGISSTDVEKNKMMWDSTREDRDWKTWLNSKGNITGADKYNFKNATTSLFPIMQFSRNTRFNDTERIDVSIASQTYRASSTIKSALNLNSVMYTFNQDYLNSIQILNPRIICANFLMQLTGTDIHILPNYEKISGKISSVIKKLLDSDDLSADYSVSDCYFTFSNDEWNEMLQDTIEKKFVQSSSNGDSLADSADAIIDNILNKESTSVSGKTQDIVNAAYEITAQKVDNGTGVLDFSNTYLNPLKIIEALLKAIIMSILTPQVMLLIVMNMDTFGMLNLDDLSGIIELIIRKLIASLGSIVVFVKDMIIGLLEDLFYEKIKPILDKVCFTLALEELNSWIELLTEALELFRSLRSSLKSLLYGSSSGMLDKVNYADIVNNELTAPQSDSKC